MSKLVSLLKKIWVIILIIAIILVAAITFLMLKKQDVIEHKFLDNVTIINADNAQVNTVPADISKQLWAKMKEHKTTAPQGQHVLARSANKITTFEPNGENEFNNAMRAVLPQGATMLMVEDFLKLTDECFKLDEQNSTANVRIYQCSFSPNFTKNETRMVVVDKNQRLVDFFINERFGIHNSKSIDDVLSDQETNPVDMPEIPETRLNIEFVNEDPKTQ